jgi:alpha-L-fucosidase
MNLRIATSALLIVLFLPAARQVAASLRAEELPITTGPFEPTWKSLSHYQCPDWFRDAKFGIWAHWTAQCVPEQGDWYARAIYQSEGVNRRTGQKTGPSSQYNYQVAHYGHPSKVGFKDIDRLWHAENWEPEKLIDLYKRAGAKYFVALANHHDNFDCYDSKYQPWNSVNMGPKKDIVGGWAKAARAAGLRFGVTVHAARAWTWFEVAQGADGFGPLQGVPYDGKLTKADGQGTWWEGYDPQDLYAQNHKIGDAPSREYCEKFFNRTLDLVHKYQPDLLYFDDRVLPLANVDENYGLKIAADFYNSSVKWHGRNEAVMNTKILDAAQQKCFVLDIERGKSARIEPRPWQTDTCLGDWHYSRDIYDHHAYKKPGDVVRMLVDIVSKNGNLLLNVPVRGDGTIDDQETACLEGIAAWMKSNSEAIFGTRPWIVYGEGAGSEQRGGFGGLRELGKYSAQDIRFTQKAGVLYAIAMGRPSGKVKVKALNGKKAAKVTLLGSEEKLAWQQDDAGLTIDAPSNVPSEFAAAFKIEWAM